MATPKSLQPYNPLKGSHRDREQARTVPDTPQTRAPAYRLAFDDMDFLCRPETRGVRLQLEMMKPELHQQEAGIISTTVLFGGARIAEPGTDPWAAKNETQRKNLIESSRYYEEAREFANARRYDPDNPWGTSKARKTTSRRRSSSRKDDSFGAAVANVVIKELKGTTGRRIVRGLLGGLFKGR